MIDFLHSLQYKTYIGLFLSSLFAGYWLVPRVIWLGRGLGAYAKGNPSNTYSQTQLGGLAIGLPFIFGISLLMMLRNEVSQNMYMVPLQMRGLFFGSCLALTLGFLQDLLRFNRYVRLGLKTGLAVTGYYYTFRFNISTDWGPDWNVTLIAILTILWIIGFISLIDLIERKTQSFPRLALVAILFLLVISFVLDQYRAIVVCSLLAGGLLSLLSPSASIRPRLGRTGTYLLGYTIATTLLESHLIEDTYNVVLSVIGIGLFTILVWTLNPSHILYTIRRGRLDQTSLNSTRALEYFQQAYSLEINTAKDIEACWSILCKAATTFGYGKLLHFSSTGSPIRSWSSTETLRKSFTHNLEYAGGILEISRIASNPDAFDEQLRLLFVPLLEAFDRRMEQLYVTESGLGQNKLRIVIVNRYFSGMSATGQIVSDLAEDLYSDADITILTGSIDYTTSEPIPGRNEILNGIHIYRIPATHFGRSSTFNRTLDFIFFYLFTVFWILKTPAKHHTHILTFTDPPLISIVGLLAKKLKGWKYTYVIQDLYPETALALSVMRPGFLFKLCYKLNCTLLRTSDLVITIGQKMAQHIREIAGGECKIEVISNWANGEIILPSNHTNNELISRLNLKDVYTVIYAGNMGLAQEIDSLIKLISLFKGRSDIQFIFIGGGTRYNDIETAIADQRLDNVRLLPHQTRSDLSAYLGLADIGIVTLAVELEGLAIPTRTYCYFAAGLPILGIAHAKSELEKFAEEGLGVHFQPDSMDAITAWIDQEICQGSHFSTTEIRHQFEARFDRPLQTRKYLAALDSIN